MPGKSLQVELLRRAAESLGGEEELRRQLTVSRGMLGSWLHGRAPLPDHLLLRVVDILQSASPPPEFPVVEGLGRSRFWDSDFLVEAERKAVLEAALEAALELTGSRLGNIQVKRPDGLHIEAHRGFSRRFLDFFAVVKDGESACGEAMRLRGRVVVEDVRASAVFADRPSKGTLLEEGVLAVQSTPVVSSRGALLGMVSTHDRESRDLSHGCAGQLDLVARRLADWLEWRTAGYAR